MNIANEQFISIDTNQTIMEEADTLMEEYEQQKIDQLNQRVKEMEASNQELRGMVCEFAHYLACPAYVLRPETVKTIIDIAAEERNRK